MKAYSPVVVLMIFFLVGQLQALDRRQDFGAGKEKQKRLIYTEKRGLVVPFDCAVFVSADGGSAGAKSELGLGLSAKTFRPILKNLPQRAALPERVEHKLGTFAAGKSIPFALRTTWMDKIHFAFIKNRDIASRTAFFDVDRSRVLPGWVLKKVDKNTYQLRLDDAASHLVDDNEGDLVIQIRLKPILKKR